MIRYQDFRENKAAFLKAQNQRPVVIKSYAAGYIVLGATAIYTVKIAEDYSVSCTCTASQHYKFCYHAASALIQHVEEAEAAAASFEAAAKDFEESENERLYVSEAVR
jgi:hypothetical protein